MRSKPLFPGALRAQQVRWFQASRFSSGTTNYPLAMLRSEQVEIVYLSYSYAIPQVEADGKTLSQTDLHVQQSPSTRFSDEAGEIPGASVLFIDW